MEKELVAFGVESSMRRDVYLVLKKAADAYGDDDATLSEEEKRFMEKRLVDYERNGMSLAPEAMKEVEALKKELADLSTTFSTNIAEDDSKHLVTAAELEGCSEAFIEGLEKDPGGSGKLVLQLIDAVFALALEGYARLLLLDALDAVSALAAADAPGVDVSAAVP